MTTRQTKNLARVLLPLLLGVFVVLGCVTLKVPVEAEQSAVSASPGARLWQENCVRCHNLRPPTAYSDREWRIATHHMRLRANLTGEEHSSILAFLQNGF